MKCPEKIFISFFCAKSVFEVENESLNLSLFGVKMLERFSPAAVAMMMMAAKITRHGPALRTRLVIIRR